MYSKLFQHSLLITLISLSTLIIGAGTVACKSPDNSTPVVDPAKGTQNLTVKEDPNHFLNPNLPPRPPAPKGIENGLQRATFAGGCFWCMEKPFETVKGVKSVTSGYTGGTYDKPSYKAVSSHSTDQVEAIDIIYDPAEVSYKELLEVYWRQIDPTDDGGQFVDRGNQYRPFIWVHNDSQRQDAEASKKALQETKRFDKPIIVPIVDAVTFWPAEDYHQDFYKKDPKRYYGYRSHSGRDQFLQKYWGKKSKE